MPLSTCPMSRPSNSQNLKPHKPINPKRSFRLSVEEKVETFKKTVKPNLPQTSAQCSEDEFELSKLSNDHWTESRVTECLCNHTGTLPQLLDIKEVHVRLRASHKFHCVFANNVGEECRLALRRACLHALLRSLRVTRKNLWMRSHANLLIA